MFEKRYVTPEEGRQEFPTGVGIWADCERCERPIIVPEGRPHRCSDGDCWGKNGYKPFRAAATARLNRSELRARR